MRQTHLAGHDNICYSRKPATQEEPKTERPRKQTAAHTTMHAVHSAPQQNDAIYCLHLAYACFGCCCGCTWMCRVCRCCSSSPGCRVNAPGVCGRLLSSGVRSSWWGSTSLCSWLQRCTSCCRAPHVTRTHLHSRVMHRHRRSQGTAQHSTAEQGQSDADVGGSAAATAAPCGLGHAPTLHACCREFVGHRHAVRHLLPHPIILEQHPLHKFTPDSPSHPHSHIKTHPPVQVYLP